MCICSIRRTGSPGGSSNRTRNVRQRAWHRVAPRRPSNFVPGDQAERLSGIILAQPGAVAGFWTQPIDGGPAIRADERGDVRSGCSSCSRSPRSNGRPAGMRCTWRERRTGSSLWKSMSMRGRCSGPPVRRASRRKSATIQTCRLPPTATCWRSSLAPGFHDSGRCRSMRTPGSLPDAVRLRRRTCRLGFDLSPSGTVVYIANSESPATSCGPGFRRRRAGAAHGGPEFVLPACVTGRHPGGISSDGVDPASWH